VVRVSSILAVADLRRAPPPRGAASGEALALGIDRTGVGALRRGYIAGQVDQRGGADAGAIGIGGGVVLDQIQWKWAGATELDGFRG